MKSVEKVVGKDLPSFFCSRTRSRNRHNSSTINAGQQICQEEAVDEQTTEHLVLAMSEVDPGESETGQKMWHVEVITLE